MSIFKTTLKVESANSSTSQINFTTSLNNDLTDDIIFGKVLVNSNIPTQINPESKSAKGSYLYVKSSATNPKHTAINIGNEGQEISTLYVGEFAIIPLSQYQGSLYAFTTHGTAELEYFFGSRGEEIGENVLITWKNAGTSTWYLCTLDVSKGVPGQQQDTGINYTDYPDYAINGIVNRKGYNIRFYNGGDQLFGTKIVYVDSKGNLGHMLVEWNFNSYIGDGRANLITYMDDADTGHVIYFDGDTVSTQTFPNIINLYVENNWDGCTADGTFPLYIEGYNGSISAEAVFLIKGADSTLIKTTDYNNLGEYSNSYVYSHGNFVAVETLSNMAPFPLSTLEIFSTTGTLLKSVNFGGMNVSVRDFYFYGSGKLQVVYTEFMTGTKTFLNYNQLTGKLIGEDLQWTSTLNMYEVICENYYTAFSRNYKPESIAIIMNNNDFKNDDYFLNQNTNGNLQVTYIINNDLEHRNYIVPSTENNYYVTSFNNYDYDRIQATINDFVLLSANNSTSGTLVATRFTSNAEPTKFDLIPDLSLYSIIDVTANYNTECFGDYRLLSIRFATGSPVLKTIVYDSKILDTFNVSLYYSYIPVLEYNSLVFIDYGPANTTWYFNTSTKKMVNLNTYTQDYKNTQSEGDQYPVSSGKTILITWNQTSMLLYGRIINKGVASNEKEILRVGDVSGFELSNVFINMSTETITVLYRENLNDTHKVRVFDLNLNFLYEVDTLLFNESGMDTFGRINHLSFNNNDDNYTFYNFNKLLNSVTINIPTNYSTTFNNFNWWD